MGDQRWERAIDQEYLHEQRRLEVGQVRNAVMVASAQIEQLAQENLQGTGRQRMQEKTSPCQTHHPWDWAWTQ